jgi:transcriptional regulator with XRE-family HTH domain
MDEIVVDGPKIRALRKKRNWSQKELAEASGVDQGVISRLEVGTQGSMRIDRLVAVARALRVATDDLFVSSDSPPVDPTDPQIDVMMQLVENMTPEERKSAEMFLRFVLEARRQQKHAKKK